MTALGTELRHLHVRHRYGDGTTSRPFVLEPPTDHPVRKIADLWHQVEREPDEATRNALFKELLDIHKEHPYMIGTVGEDHRRSS